MEGLNVETHIHNNDLQVDKQTLENIYKSTTIPEKIFSSRKYIVKKDDDYNIYYHTTYQSIEDIDKSDTQYRLDLLRTFNIDFHNLLKYDKYDSTKSEDRAKTDEVNDELDLYKLDLFELIDERVESIYTIFQDDNEQFKKILELSANRMFTYDKLTGFMLLFSYQTFHLIHKTIQFYLEYKGYSKPILDEIEKLVT